MLKKLISMATATLLMAGGLSMVAMPSALASVPSSDATFGLIQIKGVTVTDLGTPNATLTNVVPGSVTITPTQNSGSGFTMFRPTDYMVSNPNITGAYIQRFAAGWDINSIVFNSNSQSTPNSFTNGDLIVAKQFAQDGTTFLYYAIEVTVGISAPVIATTSTIAEGDVNPTITVTSTGQLSAMPSDWTFTVGTTGLQQSSTNTAVQGRIVIGFTGTAHGGNITIQGKTTAFNPTASLASNTLTITVPGTPYQQGGSSSSASNAAAAAAAAAKAAAAKAAAAVVAAKNTLVDTLKAGKPITASDLNAADISVASTKAAERVNAKILALPEAKRADLATLQAIVRTENFVDKVSTPTTQAMVTSHDLVREGLVTADYKFKATVIRALINTDPAALSSIEKVQAAVKAALASVQARKDRLAATIAKINGTK